MVINAQNKEKYLEDLKNWLCELENAPLEEMGAFFRKRLPEYEARMTKFWGEDYKQFARAVPESAKRILDLGCGTGLELDALYNLRTDISVIGIDLSPDMLDVLMKKHGDKDLTLLCGSYFAVPFPGAFDAVISFESLHHFLPEKKRRLFKRIYDCLTPGGMFVNGDYFACCDEEENLLRETWSRKRREENIPDDAFVHFDIPLTKEHEAALLKEVGFTVTVENGNDCSIIKAVK